MNYTYTRLYNLVVKELNSEFTIIRLLNLLEENDIKHLYIELFHLQYICKLLRYKYNSGEQSRILLHRLYKQF
jgi:high-affinity nickel permease